VKREREHRHNDGEEALIWAWPSSLAQNEANSEEEASQVDTPRRFVLAAALVATAAIGFSIGKIATAPAAEAAAAHRYTLRLGDSVTIPAVKQRCAVYTEGGSPELYCARPLQARHQVTIFRDSILIWKVGHPDRPAWSGKP
jgi:hypothetical protein